MMRRGFDSRRVQLEIVMHRSEFNELQGWASACCAELIAEYGDRDRCSTVSFGTLTNDLERMRDCFIAAARDMITVEDVHE